MKIKEIIEEKLASYRNWRVRREKIRLFRKVKSKWIAQQRSECQKRGNKCSACPYPALMGVCNGNSNY